MATASSSLADIGEVVVKRKNRRAEETKVQRPMRSKWVDCEEAKLSMC